MDKFVTSPDLPITIQSKTDEFYIVEGRLVAFDVPGPWDGYTFTDDTEFSFPTQQSLLAIPDAPTLYDHGYDPIIGKEPLGQLIPEGTQKKKDGIWIKAQIKRALQYADEVAELIDGKFMGLSSGGATHTAQARKEAGKIIIEKWPIIENSITPIPANPATGNLVVIQGNALQSRWLERNPQNNPNKKDLTGINSRLEAISKLRVKRDIQNTRGKIRAGN